MAEKMMPRGMAPPLSIRPGIDMDAARVLRGQAPVRPDTLEEVHLYSTGYVYAGGQGKIASNVMAPHDLQLFVETVGRNGQGLPSGLNLDYGDTNWIGTAGRVPDGYGLVIWEIGLGIRPLRADVIATNATLMRKGPVAASDIDQVIAGSLVYVSNHVEKPVVSLSYLAESGNVQFGAGSLIDSTAASGAVAGPPAYTSGGLGEDTTAGRTIRSSAVGGGMISPATRFRLEVPISLRAGEQFNFTLRWERPRSLLSPAYGGTGGFAACLDVYGFLSSPIART